MAVLPQGQNNCNAAVRKDVDSSSAVRTYLHIYLIVLQVEKNGGCASAMKYGSSASARTNVGCAAANTLVGSPLAWTYFCSAAAKSEGGSAAKRTNDGSAAKRSYVVLLQQARCWHCCSLDIW